MLIPLWGNTIGFGIMAFWFGMSLAFVGPINSSVGQGYFMALTWSATDLAIRATFTRAHIRKLGLPPKVNSAINADAIWLVSSHGPTFYVPVWILAGMIAAGSYALDHYL